LSVSERIRKYIDSNGIRMNFVADKAGINQKRFYRILNGESSLTVDEYETICKEGLSLKPSYFFEDKFSKSEKNS
jgi:transcriptional regulator with XRE-family HTH domain